eukprot:Selendium_serpulae@DN5783_c0_g1_i1.p1
MDMQDTGTASPVAQETSAPKNQTLEVRLTLEDVIKEYSELAELLETTSVAPQHGSQRPHEIPPDEFERQLQSHIKKCLKKLRKANVVLDKSPEVLNPLVRFALLNHLDQPPTPPQLPKPSPPVNPSPRVTYPHQQHSKADPKTQNNEEFNLGTAVAGRDPSKWLAELAAATVAEQDATRGELQALQALHQRFSKHLDVPSGPYFPLSEEDHAKAWKEALE